MTPKQHAFNVLLSVDHVAKLSELARHAGCSRGLVIRQLISRAFLMDIEHAPTCASGRPCLVPALHAQQMTQAPPTPTEGTAP